MMSKWPREARTLPPTYAMGQKLDGTYEQLDPCGLNFDMSWGPA